MNRSEGWSAEDVDSLTQVRETVASKIANTVPLEKVSETLQNDFGDEIPSDLETDQQGRLFMKYLRYTGIATSDITASYDRMLVNISNLIKNNASILESGIL